MLELIKTNQVQPIQTQGTVYNSTSGRGNADDRGSDENYIEKQFQHYGFRSFAPPGTERAVLKDHNLAWSVAENDGNLPQSNIITSMKQGDVVLYHSSGHGIKLTTDTNGNPTLIMGIDSSGSYATLGISTQGAGEVEITLGITNSGDRKGAGISIGVDKGGIAITPANNMPVLIFPIESGVGSVSPQGLATASFVAAVSTALAALGETLVPLPTAPFVTSTLLAN